MAVFSDIRQTIMKHATKKFSTRSVDGIIGGVFHQTAGSDKVHATARYHVGPNHVSQTGCPGILYTFFVNMKGEIFWCNDLEAKTWSQGGKGTPVPGSSANRDFVAVVLGGAFDGSGWKGKNPGPPFLQIHAALVLWGHLTGALKEEGIPDELHDVLSCPVEALYGHHKFGKPACPGSVMISVVDSVRSYLQEEGGVSLGTDKAWQEALIKLGYDLGSWGADGDWGATSRSALTQFQREHGGLTVDGIKGRMGETAILSAISSGWKRP